LRGIKSIQFDFVLFDSSQVIFSSLASYRAWISEFGGGWGISSLVDPAIIFPKAIPTPSMTARRTAQPMALFRAALTPPRKAREPPVKKPAL
jgi:hypothetical protein